MKQGLRIIHGDISVDYKRQSISSWRTWTIGSAILSEKNINIWKTAAAWVIRVRMLAVQPLGPAENLIEAKTEVLTDTERVTAAFTENSLGQAASSPRTTLGSILTNYTNASLTPGYHFR